MTRSPVLWTYGLAFALTLSVVLGIGFLALPARLVHSGLPPFLATFAVNLAAQVVVLAAGFDVIQRGMALIYAEGCLEVDSACHWVAGRLQNGHSIFSYLSYAWYSVWQSDVDVFGVWRR
jgi:hypothetical protein